MRVGVADECLVEMGYASGVRGVVRRFHEHLAALQELVLRWRPDTSQTAGPVGEFAVHPNGQFILEVGRQGAGRLTHVWPGWGRRVVGTGSPEDLRSEALRILRRGGPFGGPMIARTGEHIVQVRQPHGGMRQPLSDGSEVRVLLLEQTALAVRVWPNGKFAHLPMAGAQADPSKMIEDDAEYLLIGSTRTPWIYTDLHPLVGTIRADPYDLLLCALRVDIVGLLAVKGDQLLGLKVGPWEEIRTTDIGPWLADLAARSRPSDAKPAAAADAAKAPTGEKKATAEPGSAGAAGERKSTGQASAAGDKGKAQGEATRESARTRRKRVATSQGGMPGPRERRVRLKPALAAVITQHLASVASKIPAGVLGAAFAVELLLALEAAALSDHPTLTGKTVDLFSRLHKKGFLSSIPADQAGRAALKLLAERTPLVRRLHYRRWCFAFGDIHDPASGLRARLGPIPE